jgi:PAS domain S-box-containing protein
MSIPASEARDRPPPSAWVDLTSAYLRARFVIALVASISAVAAGILSGWVRGPWVLVIALLAAVHAYVIESRRSESATAILALDAALFAAVNVFTGLLTIGLFSLTFLMVSAAVLERGRQVYLLWSADVVLIGAALVASAQLPLAGYTDVERTITEVITLVFITWAAVSLTRTLADKLQVADGTRRVAESELTAEKRRYRALLEHSIDGLTVADASLRVFELGEQNHRITGYEAEERVGGSLLDLVVSEDRASLVSACRHVMENPRSPAFFEARVTRRDGEVRTMAAWVRNLMDDPDMGGLVFDFHDVTEEKAARSELEQANERLAEMIRSKDEFIASVSHELRTPLTAVLGMSEILNEEPDLTEVERRELHAILVTQARHASAIVNDLLVAARAGVGQVSVAAVRCDLGSLVSDAVGVTTKDLDLSVDVPPGLAVTADPTRVLQVLRNLVTNAERHGGGRLMVSAKVEGDLVLVAVADDGPGVPDEDAATIFEPYHRSGATLVPGSIGLGLSVSRLLARLMGGDVVYRRQEGLTIFEFSVPLHGASRMGRQRDLERSVVVTPG